MGRPMTTCVLHARVTSEALRFDLRTAVSCVCVAEVGVVTALVPSSLELPSELGADLVQTWVSIHLPQGWLRARGNSQFKLNIQPVPASSLKWSLS